MRTSLTLIGCATLVIGGPVQAESRLPSAGACTMKRDGFPDSMALSVSWMGDKAIVNDLGKSTQGRVVGMRGQNDSFRLSVFWDDPISGPSEIAIFETAAPGPRLARYRMANVSFEHLQNGERVIKAIEGYYDAECTVVR